MEQQELNNDILKRTRNKAKVFVTFVILSWMTLLFFFLNKSRDEHSLVFAQILPNGWKPTPPNFNIVIDDSTDWININPQIDPNLVILDTNDIDSIIVNPQVGSSFSLKQYAPPVLSQGQLGSCVAWATTYAGTTIVKRIEMENKANSPFAPLELYVRMKKLLRESPCSYGAYIPYALNLLKRKGCTLFKNASLSCEKVKVSNDVEYRDKLYGFDEISSKDISKIKRAISNKMPIVFGIDSYENFGWHNAVLVDGVWNGYHSGNKDGGHAMCIVGYDDKKAGGSFEIMNSWGEDWGNKGFFWIKYEDFKLNVDECYALLAKPRIK